MSVGAVDPTSLGLWSHSILAELGDFCWLLCPRCTSLGWASQSLAQLNASPVPHAFCCNLFVWFFISGSACLCLPTWQLANLINLIESSELLQENCKSCLPLPLGLPFSSLAKVYTLAMLSLEEMGSLLFLKWKMNFNSFQLAMTD